MKRIICLLASVTILLCGCSMPPRPDLIVEDTAYDEPQDNQHLNKIKSGLQEMLSQEVQIIVNEDDALPDVMIVLPADFDITLFGNCVYDSLKACNAVIGENGYTLTVYLKDTLFFNTDFGNMGHVVDSRSGENEMTFIETEDDLCELFPALISHISKENLSQADLAIYEEVMQILNEQYDRSEDEIYAELAPSFDMSVQQLQDFMMEMIQRVHSDRGQDTSRVPIKYPATTNSKYIADAKDAPIEIYSTSAEENGLEGCVYVVYGTVDEVGVLQSNEEPTIPYMKITTDEGVVSVVNTYEYAQKYYQEDFAALEEAGSDYSFPSVGEYVKVYCTYMGFSEELQMPSLVFGAPEWIVESLSDSKETEDSID